MLAMYIVFKAGNAQSLGVWHKRKYSYAANSNLCPNKVTN